MDTNSHQLLVIDSLELSAIEKSKAEQIKSVFQPMALMLEEFEAQFNEIMQASQIEITEELTRQAKRLRLDIGKVRINTEKLRQEQKEEYLRAGKAIDGVSNILKWAVTDKENKLKEIENYFEIQEQKRLQALQDERVQKILPYLPDAAERDFKSMDDDVYETFYQMKKKAFEDEQEALRKAEQERITKEKEQAEERERMRQENEKLKAEAAERERLAKIEQQKRLEEEKKIKARQEAERKALEEKLRKEREEKERIQKELKAKEEALRLQKEKEEEDRQSELGKNDSQKVKNLIQDLNDLKTKYQFKSAKNQKMYSDVNQLIDKVINFIQK